jgi:hypothetical protein
MGMPMGEDFLTIIMGLDDPCEPGMHGPLKEPCPTDDAVGLVTKIRDMCDEWLRSAGKDEDKTTAPPEVGDNDQDDESEEK